MKNILLILLLSPVFVACENCDPDAEVYPACSVDNPVEDLVWLREEIQDREQNPTELTRYEYILRATYEGETVFVYGDCCPNCLSIIRVFNCRGEEIEIPQSDGYLSALTDTTVIWQPQNFECIFS